MIFFLVIRETVCFKNGLSTFLLFSHRTGEGAFARIADFTLEYFSIPKHFQEVEHIDELLVVGFAGDWVKSIKFGSVLPIFIRNSGVWSRILQLFYGAKIINKSISQ